MYRNNLTAFLNGDALVRAVALQNNNTIVVINSVGPLILESWIEHPNVTAVIWAGLGGTETGNALVDVIYGAVNPSGRLPYTLAKSVKDYPAQVVLGGDGEEILNITYSEGCVFDFLILFSSQQNEAYCNFICRLFVDYRHFDAKNITPRFEFGFGMSYTQFQYSCLSVTPGDTGQDQDGQLERNWMAAKPGPRGVGSSTALWLHRPAYTVSFTVENTGQVAGTEVRIIIFVPFQPIYCACGKKIDITGLPAFPRWRGRATLHPARFHRRRVAAWRVEDGQCDAFEVRLVGLGCVQSDVGTRAGDVLAFGWR